ncbi:MAG: archease [Phycisphaerae bacterium]
MTREKIEILEHTADLAIRINAVDAKELFELGATAVYQLIGEPVRAAGESRVYSFSLQANSQEELLHDWLAEALYWFQVRQIVFERYEFEVLRPTHVKVKAEGWKIDVEKSIIHIEIKAVTYHNLHIKPNEEGLTATVIFDV